MGPLGYIWLVKYLRFENGAETSASLCLSSNISLVTTILPSCPKGDPRGMGCLSYPFFGTGVVPFNPSAWRISKRIRFFLHRPSKMDKVQVGIIGMGDMGRMYAQRFSQAGWRYISSALWPHASRTERVSTIYPPSYNKLNDDLSAFGSSMELQMLASSF